ncbi:MAG: hypothetical protein ACRD6X_21965 [Pyrinomonadaceae bacterium]
MENTLFLANSRVETANPGRFVMDTTFVLFFLALDIGTSYASFGFDTLLSAVTLTMFASLPYFLPFAGEKPDFTGWLVGRMFIAAIGILAGLAVAASVGTMFPESVRFLPMTLLIIAGIFCTYTQIYAMLKVRLAR